MYKIVIQDRCKCFLDSSLENNIQIESKDEALEKATKIMNTMNETFCKKHSFEIQEMFNNFIIRFYKEEQKRYCCGNGCCM